MKIFIYLIQFLIISLLLVLFKLLGYRMASNFGGLIGTFFGQMFRSISYEKIKSSSLQTRALAGVANSKFIFVLPGSLDACKTAWNEIIRYQLDDKTKPCNLVMLMPRLKK